MPRRAKKTGKAQATPLKGRAISTEEFERMPAAVPNVVEKLIVTDKVDFDKAVASWQFYLRGLWCSGLRLEKSLQLHWTDYAKLCIVDIDDRS